MSRPRSCCPMRARSFRCRAQVRGFGSRPYNSPWDCDLSSSFGTELLRLQARAGCSCPLACRCVLHVMWCCSRFGDSARALCARSSIFCDKFFVSPSSVLGDALFRMHAICTCPYNKWISWARPLPEISPVACGIAPSCRRRGSSEVREPMSATPEPSHWAIGRVADL